MWKCEKCGKPVYFAERKQSLGYDWHPYCLKCDECGKVLSPGQHAEHKGVPYCHIPCYAALFGPKLFGHGSTTESHRSFGQRQNSFIKEQEDLQKKVNDFNRYYHEASRSQISSREVNGRLVFEGVLKIYWGTEGSVRLKEFEDTRLITRQRKALSMGFQYEEVGDNDPQDEMDIPEEDTSLSLPYFNPFTHPLYNKTDGNCDSLIKSEDIDDDIDFDDIDTDSFLSNDPLHKWQTLGSLIDSKPDFEQSDPTDNILNQEHDNDKIPEQNDMNDNEILSQSHIPEIDSITDTKSSTLPSSLSDLKDDLDDLLIVERNYNDHDRYYHTVHGNPVRNGEHSNGIQDVGQNGIEKQGSSNIDKDFIILDNGITSSENESHIEESRSGKKFIVEKLENLSDNSKISFKMGAYEPPSPQQLQTQSIQSEEFSSLPPQSNNCHSKSTGPRALKRRPGRKMDKNKLKRRTSFNGHWYDRDTSVFTPPKHAPMSVYTTSKSGCSEVLTLLLDKYKIESDQDQFALYVVKETGERRIIKDDETPLRLRVNLGPHEEIAKIYLMDRKSTEEISHNTAQFIKFSITELRSFLNMFYEEEEREADRIRTKYQIMKRRMQRRLEQLNEAEGLSTC